MVVLAAVAGVAGTALGLRLPGRTGIRLGARLVRCGDVVTPLRPAR